MAAKVPLLFWKVLNAPTNGAKIAGKKGRKLGDVFQAAEAMVHMQALEGVVAECTADGTLKAAPAPAASPAATTPAPAATAAAGTTATGH